MLMYLKDYRSGLWAISETFGNLATHRTLSPRVLYTLSDALQYDPASRTYTAWALVYPEGVLKQFPLQRMQKHVKPVKCPSEWESCAITMKALIDLDWQHYLNLLLWIYVKLSSI